MPFIVGLADSTQKSLLAFEKAAGGGIAVGAASLPGFSHARAKSSTLRLIRTACKGLHHKGCEQSGVSA